MFPFLENYLAVAQLTCLLKSLLVICETHVDSEIWKTTETQNKCLSSWGFDLTVYASHCPETAVVFQESLSTCVIYSLSTVD